MSQILSDDLEEGEIADDVVTEPILEKKAKALPRRYVINDKKLKSRHKKKNRKYNSKHHKRKDNKSYLYFDTFPKKHHKSCPKHNSLNLSDFPDKSDFSREEFRDFDSNSKKSHLIHLKTPLVKCAFKNFRSPPRKVSKVGSSNSLSSPSKFSKNYPHLLSEYKKTQNELNKLKNNTSFQNQDGSENKRPACKMSNNLASPQKCKNNSPVEIISIEDTDDEDEEELRRIALATCLKRSTALPDVSSEDSSSKLNCPEPEATAIVSDNYEVVDMDVDNEPENVEKIDNLFVIDTTPSYFYELNGGPSSSSFASNQCLNHLNNDIINGFLPNINLEDPYQNFDNDLLSQNLNNIVSQNLNNLYTNFEVDNSRLPSSQIEDDFEEELLRAELIANMKSSHQAKESSLPKNDTASAKNIDLVSSEFKKEASNDTRVVRLKCGNKNDSSFKDRIVSIKSDVSINDSVYKEDRTVSVIRDVVKDDKTISIIKDVVKDDRTVSIIKDVVKDDRTVSIIKDAVKENPVAASSRTVSSHMKPNLPIKTNSSFKKGVDIKVKLNNAPQNQPVSNIVSLPQERIIISLNNDSSSEESDHDYIFKPEPEKNPAVASLEALISNARQESDGKKISSNSNGSSDALSCLSKAQQEEYNSLIKILAKKKDTTVQNTREEIKKVVENPDLTLFKKKRVIAKSNYEKEKSQMNTLIKELTKKKRAYMLSKIKAQQMKEQYLTAEKVRKANLQLWTKCASELQTLKKSVSKRQALITSLETKISTFFPDSIPNGLSMMSNHTPEQEYPLR